MPTPKIALVVGTRPEAIKVATVMLELRKYSDVCQPVLLSTGQHREMLSSALGAFGLQPDVDLEIMRPGQTLAGVTARAVEGLDAWIEANKPSLILAQGDTTTTFVAGLAAFYRQVSFGHIEAGLRTNNIHDPFPEEFNRRAVGLVTKFHFAPTSLSADNLRREGVLEEDIYITGNTVVDAVKIMGKGENPWYPGEGKVVLMTTHRRENWGEPQKRIARAGLKLVQEFPDIRLVVPMHANPIVRESLTSILGNHDRIDLIEPPEYSQFVPLLKRSMLVLSDSGGVQEEAPAFGIPVLVLRETTERPEGVEAGTTKLVGTDEKVIFEEARALLSDPNAYAKMSTAASPFGDGFASERIRSVCLRHLGISSPGVEGL